VIIINYLHTILGSTCVYIFIVVAIRLFGKKEIAQLSIIDLVFILLISNAVQYAMVGTDTTIIGGLVAAGTLFIVNFILKYILYRFPGLSSVVQGNPLIIVHEGKVLEENRRKARISIAEIEEAVREHGVPSIEDVNLAIMEVDGNISVISNDYKNHSRLRKKFYKDIV